MSDPQYRSPTLATDRRPWRIAGALMLTDVVLTFLGAGIDGGAPELGAGRSEVLDAFAGTVFAQRLVGGSLEFLAVLTFLAWALLVGRLLVRPGLLAGWLASVTGATAVLVAALTLGSVAIEIAAGYDGAHGATGDLLGIANDGADVAYFGALGLRGLFLVCVAVAGLMAHALPRWWCRLALAVGVVGFVSPLGAGAGLHQLAFLAGIGWTVALAVVALAGRPVAPATLTPVEGAPSVTG